MKKLIFLAAFVCALASTVTAQISITTIPEAPYAAQRLTFYDESGTAVTALGVASGTTVTVDTVVSSWFDIGAYDSVSFNLWVIPGDTIKANFYFQYGIDADTGKSVLNDAIIGTSALLDSSVYRKPNGQKGYVAGDVVSMKCGGNRPDGAQYARVLIASYAAADAAHGLGLQGTAGTDSTKLNNNRLWRRRANK